MQRTYFINKIDFQYDIHSVCALLGPRQVGKTTLAKQYAKKYPDVHFIDLENPIDLARLQNPFLALSEIKSELVVIDEIQRLPELFPVLRVLVDEKPRKYLILGSASRDLLQQSSETLAGRIGYIELPPFSLAEVEGDYKQLWLRGGFPRSYLAKSNRLSYSWRQAYISTFMERDIPSLGFNIPRAQMRRLWMMLAYNNGNILNSSELGVSLAVTHHTVRKYIEILAGTFMIRILDPWFENINKRQVKSPKVYIRDTGLLHALLGIQDENDLNVYSRLGASWEGFALEEIIKLYHARSQECFFWATQSGAELDLLIMKNGKRVGFEMKYTDSPKITKSIITALEDLRLDHVYVIHPHRSTFSLSEKVSVVGIEDLERISSVFD